MSNITITEEIFNIDDLSQEIKNKLESYFKRELSIKNELRCPMFVDRIDYIKFLNLQYANLFKEIESSIGMDLYNKFIHSRIILLINEMALNTNDIQQNYNMIKEKEY